MSIDLLRLKAQYDSALEFLRAPDATAHFVGVAGVGMAGLASLLHGRGIRVSGCDADESAPTVAGLKTSGIPFSGRHDPKHISSLNPACDRIVRTPAANLSSPELAAAAERGIPILDRGTVLAAFLDSLPNPLIAVCGTHGKTTTATFATSLLRAFGSAPGCCIGAPNAPAALPGETPPPSPFVAECDESDGTLALYHPAVTVIGSVDFDHAEHFDSEVEFLSVFDSVLSQTRHAVVYNVDDASLHAYVSAAVRQAWRAFPVGTSSTARLRATAVTEEGSSGISFDLSYDGAPLGRFHLPIPGLHNLSNVLAALAAVSLTIPGAFDNPARLQSVLDGLRLPGRRFEVVSSSSDIRVIVDYAHHPTEIAALLRMARATMSGKGRLIAVFQPHRPSRTLALGPQFPAAFAEADLVALAPVYAASEPDIPGGSIADLYAHFRAAGQSPVLLQSLGDIHPWVRDTAKPNDTVILVGAGDIISVAAAFRSNWSAPSPLPPPIDGAEILPGASAASFCSYGVGGPVRALVKVNNLPALRALLAWCRDTATPWHVLGSGTNLLVPDAGFDGLLLRLEGGDFYQEAPPPRGGWRAAPGGVFRATAGGLGGSTPSVAASLPGASLLAEWQRLGLSGLECMDGIPGTIGGWLAMNAGAQGHAIGDCLVSLDLLAPYGTPHTVPRTDLDLGYRHAAWRGRPLSETVILSAVFAPQERTTPENVAARRQEFRRKRFDFSGLRTAGSVFRNPPDDSAGRILDAAGLKGLRIGGAEICPRHANIICTYPGATASDVLALIQIAQQRSPVPLSPEIQILH